MKKMSAEEELQMIYGKKTKEDEEMLEMIANGLVTFEDGDLSLSEMAYLEAVERGNITEKGFNLKEKDEKGNPKVITYPKMLQDS